MIYINNYFLWFSISEDLILPNLDISIVHNKLQENGDGAFFITYSDMFVHWGYKINSKYYMITDLRSIDSVDGRNVKKRKAVIDFSKGFNFLDMPPERWPKQ
ncbi:MAG: hypothetical protein FWB77_04025 [Treponema sp.]|nr:hypothetical protein [Treponema sp.]